MQRLVCLCLSPRFHGAGHLFSLPLADEAAVVAVRQFRQEPGKAGPATAAAKESGPEFVLGYSKASEQNYVRNQRYNMQVD